MGMAKYAGIATVSALVLALSACNPTPTVEKIDPQSGPETGTTVKVTGKNFKQGAKITVNNSPVATKMDSATSLSAELPAHEPGSVKIGVLNPPDKASTTTVVFEYMDATAPVVQGVEPTGELPADSAVTAVKVTYSENLAEGTLAVADDSGAAVTGSSLVDGMMLTFTADAPLAAGKTYTVSTMGAKDAAGNAAADEAFTFSIAAPAKAAGRRR